jgi:hypothetical protein
MKKKTKNAKIKSIINTAIEEAANSQYCITCRFSYLHTENGHGYCKYHDANESFTMAHLKPITDFDTCEHWEKKK